MMGKPGLCDRFPLENSRTPALISWLTEMTDDHRQRYYYSMAGWFEQIAELVWPARCVGCGANGSWWCRRCAAQVRVIGGRVPGRWPGLDGVVAGAEYRDPLSAAIKALKYRHARAVGSALIPYLLTPVTRTGTTAAALVPIPLHSARERRRGHNQAAVLAALLSQKSGLPWQSALRRIRPTPTQTGLRRHERFANVDGAFTWVAAEVPETVIILDDVVTTGATLAAAAAACRVAGVRHVWGMAVARQPFRSVSSNSFVRAAESPFADDRSR